MPMIVSERHYHRHSNIYIIMDAIGFALGSGGAPSINGRIVYGLYKSSGKDGITVSIGVSWDYGIILTAHYSYTTASDLRYPIYFTPGTNVAAGPTISYDTDSGTWDFGFMNYMSNITKSSLAIYHHLDIYFILLSYV